MSATKIKASTLVPPFNFGRKVSDEDWNRIFPKTPKRNYESDGEYADRLMCADVDSPKAERTDG